MKPGSLLHYLLSLFFPSFCVNCDAEGSFLCSACARTLVIQQAPVSRAHGSAIALTYAATEYREQPIVQKLIVAFKFRGAKNIARHCADILAAHLAIARFISPKNCIMTAVPLHKKRLRERGFNQSDCIARGISAMFAIPYNPRLLSRVLHTTPQTKLQEREKRLRNMHGAFTCATPDAVRGKTIILVDDVTTTGATLEACARVLQSAGARTIIALVVAK